MPQKSGSPLAMSAEEYPQAGDGDAQAGGVGSSRSPGSTPEPQTRDFVQINLLTVAWMWGLLPGALTGGVVTYCLWAAVANIGVKECTSSDCRDTAELLKTKLYRSVKPCDDFYSYVCRRFEAAESSVLWSISAYMRNVTEAMLHTIDVPSSHQDALQKSAGLYRACLSMVLTDRSEVPSLKNFLASVGLDVSNMPSSSDFNAVESIVRLSFEYGLPAIVRFDVFRLALQPKKLLRMEIDKNYTDWVKSNPDTKLYGDYLAEYDSNLDSSLVLVGRIIRAERTVGQFISTLPPREGQNASQVATTVGGLDTAMQQVLPKGEWTRLIVKYTDNAYGASDMVFVMQNTTELVKLLAGGGSISPYDARLLLFWRLLLQLLPMASGRVMNQSRNHFDKECFETVLGVMEIALMNAYLRYSVPLTAVKKVTAMAHNMLQALAENIAATDLIQDPVRRMSVQKAIRMRLLIAYPEDVANSTQMEAFFADFPDAHEEFFSPWLKAHSFLAQRLFRSNTTEIFPMGRANAWYNPGRNMMYIPAAIMQPPMFFGEGTAAFNYGGLGQVIGHEIMHGYDVSDILLDYQGQPWSNNNNSEALKKYAATVLCLRRSYLKAGTATAAAMMRFFKAAEERNVDVLSDVVDSEGFADYAGLLLAYTAYRHLPYQERHAVLPEVGLSAEQTFFVAHCLKWCAADPTLKRYPHYWNSRSRCIVPLRNMAQFADAFSCSPGASMNPSEKCPLW